MQGSVDENLKRLYHEVSQVLELLKELTSEVHHSEYHDVVQEMQFHLSSPYMFVIVGEVKAGKSSFINALLRAEQEVCKVAPSPMTDTIQQIIYGETHSIETINPFLKRISHPESVLKEISIVDTPGTNTIVEHHQEITERFIPHADLIVFVFEAKNPYRQSAWEFFDYINEDWRKNIIFILQQKDLMDAEDLHINIQGVQEQARKKGINSPKVFAVSAKQEKEGNPQSGYDPLRNFLNNEILDGKAPFLKLKSNLSTAISINEKIKTSIALRSEQYKLDLKFREEISETLDRQEEKTGRQIEILTENLVASYDDITKEKIDSLSQGLSFFPVLKRSFSNVFGGDKSLKSWLQDQAKDFELKLNMTLKEKLQAGVADVADDIQMMGKLVNAKITTSKKILKDSDDIFSDIAERRTHVLSDLQRSFKDFIGNSDNFYDESMLSESGSMTPNLAAGSGMAIVGVILSTVVNGAVFDITGGILTTIGVLFASASLGWKRKKVMRQFKEEVIKGRKRIETEVSEILSTYARRIKTKIDKNFYNLDIHLENEKVVIDNLNHLADTIENKIRLVEQQV